MVCPLKRNRRNADEFSQPYRYISIPTYEKFDINPISRVCVSILILYFQ